MDEQQQWRAQHYALLSTLLASPPNQALLNNLAQVEVTEPDNPMGKAWQRLIEAAREADVDAVRDEYHELFIGITEGEIIPYGSFYQTGFLHEKPLALLRDDLKLLGLERQQDKTEPEDHIAAELDVMHMILMAEGTPVVDASHFFQRHLQPWAEKFFSDLEQTPSAVFYQGVARFGCQFLVQETALLG